jgi:hypothetical protein
VSVRRLEDLGSRPIEMTNEMNAVSARWVTKRGALVRRLLSCTATVLLITAGIGCSRAANDESPVRAFTGAHTRIVWVQGDGTDPFAAGDNLVLMGFDSDDGRGERVILGEPSTYVKPMLTPLGNRIVFSSRPTLPEGPEVFIVNWDGSGLRRLTAGFALAVWQDPADGREWLYVGTDNREYNFATISRFPIDQPDLRELVWNQSMVSSDTFQVSADGRFAGGLFPWPHAGVADLSNGTWQRFGEGCWTALATVRGPLFWYFDGPHRNVTIVDVEADRRWMVSVNRAPGFDGAEVYHPRWTNHPRFMAISGPYYLAGPNANSVRAGGAQSEVYLGRFSEDFTAIDAWLRITENEGGDSYPDVWIDRARSSYAVLAGGRLGPAHEEKKDRAAIHTADGGGRLVVDARLVHAAAIPTPEAIHPYRNALVVNAYEVVGVVEGRYESSRLLVAQWAIRGARVLPEARKQPGQTYRLTLERYDAHPELEGERLVTERDEPDLPLYYDIGS